MKRRTLFYVALVCFGQLAVAQSAILSTQDSAQIVVYFKYVDKNMNQDSYDSSQYWLDKVDVMISIKRPTYFTYLFHSRQSELYYYNNLMGVGIKEINQGMAIAKALKDSVLIADSYNLLGLFCLNLNQLNESEKYLRLALDNSKEDNNIADYYNLSQKYHIYGNLAELLTKKGKLKEALAASEHSIVLATKKGKARAKALGEYTNGTILLKLKDYKKALNCFMTANQTCLNAKDFTNMRDIFLICFSGIAIANQELGKHKKAKKLLINGLGFYNKQKDINRFYSLVFINDGIQIFKKKKDFQNLSKMLEIKSEIENKNVKGSLKKVETIVKISLKNERKVLDLELQEAQRVIEDAHKNNNVFIVVFLLIMGIVFLLFLLNQRLTENNRQLKAKNAEISAASLKGQTTERQRVAIDLHDNLGSTLSALRFSMQAIDQQKLSNNQRELYQNIQETLNKAYNDVRLLAHNLLPEDFEKQGLTLALQGFVRKLNKSTDIRFDLQVSDNFGRIDNQIEFELYSICLELVTNILKHSKASEAKIELTAPLPPEGELKLVVSDNGIGVFSPSGGQGADGNGLKNVRDRIAAINGKWEIKAAENEGTVNEIVVEM